MPHQRPEQAPQQPECPTGPNGCHDRYSDGTCAYCRDAAPSPHVNPDAFRQGEALAYRRVLAFVTTLAEQEATKGRDHGRGVNHAIKEIEMAVRTLAEEASLL